MRHRAAGRPAGPARGYEIHSVELGANLAAVAYPKVARAWRPGGSMALFWDEHVCTDRWGFFRPVHEVYEREAPEVWDENHEGPARTEDVPYRTADIEGLGFLDPVDGRSFGWDRPYDAAGYLRVLDPYSGQVGLGDETRAPPSPKPPV